MLCLFSCVDTHHKLYHVTLRDSRALLLPIPFSLLLFFHIPTLASLLHTVLILPSHHSLELRPQSLDGRELVANLPSLSQRSRSIDILPARHGSLSKSVDIPR